MAAALSNLLSVLLRVKLLNPMIRSLEIVREPRFLVANRLVDLWLRELDDFLKVNSTEIGSFEVRILK
ncbi:MAG TPA: hypothetical protein VF068_07825, partial [Rubrobacter sp.]